ncbi:transposase [Frankia gtarii]|uniref:transposase n=1 Tax=Frankia gtarii TaxID=2950102 RepID=UPI0021BDFD43|nr:transposase [Frankia gtarii]
MAATDRLTALRLPPYAPELNPVERIWSMIKSGASANLAATGLARVISTIRPGRKRLRYHPEIIVGCLAARGLAIAASNHQVQQICVEERNGRRARRAPAFLQVRR